MNLWKLSIRKEKLKKILHYLISLPFQLFRSIYNANNRRVSRNLKPTNTFSLRLISWGHKRKINWQKNLYFSLSHVLHSFALVCLKSTKTFISKNSRFWVINFGTLQSGLHLIMSAYPIWPLSSSLICINNLTIPFLKKLSAGKKKEWEGLKEVKYRWRMNP